MEHKSLFLRIKFKFHGKADKPRWSDLLKSRILLLALDKSSDYAWVGLLKFWWLVYHFFCCRRRYWFNATSLRRPDIKNFSRFCTPQTVILLFPHLSLLTVLILPRNHLQPKLVLRVNRKQGWVEVVLLDLFEIIFKDLIVLNLVFGAGVVVRQKGYSCLDTWDWCRQWPC